MTVTKTMQAVVSNPSGGYHLATDVPLPVLQPGEFGFPTPGTTTYVGGCDFAGIVIASGPGVTRFQPGHRVLTFNTNGGFAEYALAVEDLSCHVPETMSFNQACSLGLAIGVAGLALFEEPGLHLSLLQEADESSVMTKENQDRPNVPTTVLISGGASASGTMATQLLKLAGYNAIVTCSPASYELCTSFGATACFDYHSTTCGADIRSHTDNTLAYVLDCVTDANTMSLCYEAIGAQGGSYIALEPTANTVKYKRRDVRADWIMANTLSGNACNLSGVYGRPRTPRHRQFGATLYKQVERWLQDGKIRSHPIEIYNGGLANVPYALQDLQAGGTVKGKKLVVPLKVEA